MGFGLPCDVEIASQQSAVVIGEQFIEAGGVVLLVVLARGAVDEMAVVISIRKVFHNCLLTGIARARAEKGHGQG